MTIEDKLSVCEGSLESRDCENLSARYDRMRKEQMERFYNKNWEELSFAYISMALFLKGY